VSQLSHAQFPLRRHPDLLVDHRRARSAAVAEPRGANDQSRDRLRWPASFRNGGRDQIGTVADIKSESGGLCEVADARVGCHGGRPHISRIERSRLRRRSGVEIVVDVRRLRKQTNLVRVVANAPFFAACLCAEFRVLWWGAATAKKSALCSNLHHQYICGGEHIVYYHGL